MTSAFRTRVLPLLVTLLVLVSSSLVLHASNDYPGSSTISSIAGCPLYTDYYPTYPSAINGNCTAGTLLVLTGTNLSSSITNTEVLLIGQHLHPMPVLSTNATTIVVRLPANPEPDLGWDEVNSLKVVVLIDGAGLWRVPPRNLGLWYNQSASAGTAGSTPAETRAS